MKLLVDIGNTRLKSSFLMDGALTESQSIDYVGGALDEQLLELWIDARPDDVAISSVAKQTVAEAVCRFSQEHWGISPRLAKYRGDLFGLRCGYDRPEALGVDRWLAMLGAWGRRQGAWLVADIGTAATLDVIDQRGQHLGGCIFAGVATQRQALSQRTAALPSIDGDTRVQLGTNTINGLALGTLMSVVGGVRELYIRSQGLPDCDGMLVALTGGASPIVSERLGANSAVYPQLVLEGLAMSEFGISSLYSSESD